MAENLEIKPVRNTTIGFKVSVEEQDEIKNFVAERNWKLSAFIRVAIKNEIKRLIEQNN